MLKKSSRLHTGKKKNDIGFLFLFSLVRFFFFSFFLFHLSQNVIVKSFLFQARNRRYFFVVKTSRFFAIVSHATKINKDSQERFDVSPGDDGGDRIAKGRKGMVAKKFF